MTRHKFTVGQLLLTPIGRDQPGAGSTSSFGFFRSRAGSFSTALRARVRHLSGWRRRVSFGGVPV
jgi:hypothetical protein